MEENLENSTTNGSKIALAVVVLASLAGGYWLMNRAPGTPASATPISAVPAAAAAAAANDPIAVAETLAKSSPTPENFLNLSLAYDRAGRHDDTIVAAKEALKLRPAYAEAWNNIASAYEGMQRWDEAIQAAQQALAIKPDLQLAKNNLAWSLAQKAKSQGK